MQFDTMASLKARFRLNLSVPGVLETLLKKRCDFLLSGGFLHYAGVQVGYSAFTVYERRQRHSIESVLLPQSLVTNHDRVVHLLLFKPRFDRFPAVVVH